MTFDTPVDALLVGWESQENLGLRYVMAYLERCGFRCALAPYFPDRPGGVVEAALRHRPRLVGFSLIFQYNLRDFGGLMDRLRAAGVAAHFTAGGHFPSLCPEQTLSELPHLDSIVRFEGEQTAAELLRELEQPKAWPAIRGLAWRDGAGVVLNPLRPLIDDLDLLPWPVRGATPQRCRGMPTAPLLASRGCLHDCSFCSIRQFYGGAPGVLRRARSAADVVAEMEHLYRSQGVRLFLFQDDDFAARSTRERQWVVEFLSCLDASELRGRIGWKISCRVDDVDPELMARCRERGLLVVYLGVESGNPAGLQTLRKRVTVDHNLRALEALRKAGVQYDMGFMLFDPDSTLESVGENLRFLRRVAELKGPPISFVKMLPLAGTAIQKRLVAEGRLTGDALRPDYRFLDKRLDYYFLFVILNFSHRNSDPAGLVERLRQAFFDAVVASAFGLDAGDGGYAAALREVCDRANGGALDILEQALDLVSGYPDAETLALRWDLLADLGIRQQQADEAIVRDLFAVLDAHNPALAAAFREADGHAMPDLERELVPA
jgi:radical SAM superfamily enzyme YgiQ (UPF0313 family)